MGEKNNQLTGTEAEGTGQGQGKGKGNPSPTTKPTRDRKGSGQGQGSGRPNTNPTTEKESSLISMVETPEVDDKEAERRKRRAELQRQRRQAKKEQKEGSPTPRAKTKADPTQIKILLSTVSMILASKEGMEQWILSDSEIDQIAKPLANILSKYEGVSKLSSEYADHVALLMACFAIFFPRIMTTLQKKKNNPKKEVKVHARRDQHTNTGTGTNGESNGATEASRGSSDRKSTTTPTNVSPILSELLPATSGF